MDEFTKSAILNLPEKEKKIILQRFECSPFLLYKPHKVQRRFHASQSRIRCFFGGNRSGKTRALIQEVIWHGTGLHPFKKVKVPSDIWVVSLDFPSSRDVVQPMIRRLLGSGYLKSWHETDKIITLTNGSTIAFKSCDSGWEKFQGAAKDMVAFDEEPDYSVFEECRMRIVSTQGCLIFAMTPMHGMTWIYDKLYEPWTLGHRDDTECFIASSRDNPFLNVAEIEALEKEFEGQEIGEARLLGRFVEFSGLIYKEFNRQSHVVKRFDIPEHWVKVRGIDPGLHNPTAVLWVAVSPEDEIYIYDEYYETGKSIKEFAEDIRVKTGLDKISYTVIDPASCSRNPAHPELKSVREEYSRFGIWTKPGNNDVVYGINAVKEKLRLTEGVGRPKLFVFSDCENFLHEMTRYRYKDERDLDGKKNPAEKPQKVHDHLMDALRYIIASNPRYTAHNELVGIAGTSFKLTRS